MKRLLATLVLPAALATGSLALTYATVTTAGAASHSTMMVKTWHGDVTKVDTMMGSHGTFTLMVGAKSYKVDYDAMTHYAMGNASAIKKGAMVSVTGTLTMTTIKATKLSI